MSEQAQTPEPPAILYKYLPPERIDVLENQELRFSPPSKFNDTFDSHFWFPASRGDDESGDVSFQAESSVPQRV
jgi:hypothetical protein